MSGPSLADSERLIAAIIGFIQGRAIAAAAELGLADFLAEGPLPVDSLAHLSGTHARSLFRLLRALESAGFFRQVSPGVFANTPLSDCLRSDIPGSLRSSIRSALSPGHGEYDAWAAFDHSLRTGQPAFDRVFGCNYWEFLERNPEKRAIADDSQRAYTALSAAAVVDGYDWGRFSVIADLGGGTGDQLAAILHEFPSCRGILFDLPEVIAQAVPHPRLTNTAGSFFDGVPAGADAYLLKSILHAWPEPEAAAILANIRKVIPQDGRLVVIESVMTDSPGSSLAKWVDLQMLAVAGGEKRSAAEYTGLFAKAGFDPAEIVPTKSAVSLIVGKPRA